MDKELLEQLKVFCTEAEIKTFVKVTMYATALKKGGKELQYMVDIYSNLKANENASIVYNPLVREKINVPPMVRTVQC